ncbi:Barwin-like endoglucanase [Venustampulla echinocandica]|uniref:Cellulase n=1 Tax=Venustampulla echinocandica TaxID=2656787 RepID=A0A370TSU0_9HELO|nr:Barwin-like endoglucanase [Venustampulla echinocandica]RDL38601.1 Barwin-like endoglucanase [Venustampulla echinocandica]
MVLPKTVLLALLPFFLQVDAQASGNGKTTRYWDCCKASCGWPGKISLASGSNPVSSCDAHDRPLSNYNAVSGCNNGATYMCSNQSPWAVSDTLSYGFAATTVAGGTESSWCCACYELTFTSGPVQGKKMIVQATNTGGDLGSNQFDLAIPGGGFGIFNGCTAEWGTPSTGWGAQYGGISSRSQCDAFPAALKAGCYWRYDWFMGADNPAISFKQVACPAAITAKSGCVRANDAINETPTGPASVSTWTSGSASATAAPVVDPGTNTGNGETVGQYKQCGGGDYTGPTVCEAPYTCKASNEFYSQCL